MRAIKKQETQSDVFVVYAHIGVLSSTSSAAGGSSNKLNHILIICLIVSENLTKLS